MVTHLKIELSTLSLSKGATLRSHQTSFDTALRPVRTRDWVFR